VWASGHARKNDLAAGSPAQVGAPALPEGLACIKKRMARADHRGDDIEVVYITEDRTTLPSSDSTGARRGSLGRCRSNFLPRNHEPDPAGRDYRTGRASAVTAPQLERDEFWRSIGASAPLPPPRRLHGPLGFPVRAGPIFLGLSLIPLGRLLTCCSDLQHARPQTGRAQNKPVGRGSA
jgi:hypothetical protein